MHFKSMYPPMRTVATEYPKDLWEKYNVEKWFTVHKSVEINTNIRKRIRRVFSVSFFLADVDNKDPDRESCIGNAERWKKKYWQGFCQLISDIRCLNGEWALRVYMSLDLFQEGYLDQIINEIGHSFEAKIHVMQEPSIGSQPGMLWRFLAFSDTSIDTCVVLDIDDRLSEFRILMINEFEKACLRGIQFGRFVGRGGVDLKFHVNKFSNAVNYPAVLGSFVLCSPRKARIADLSQSMKDFVKSMMQRSRMYEDCRIENFYPCDLPVDSHVYGWGAHWTMYGFDERYLKQVLLYLFAERGALLSFVTRDSYFLPEVKADISFVESCSKQNKVIIVNP